MYRFALQKVTTSSVCPLRFNNLNVLYYYHYAYFFLHYVVSQSLPLFLRACLLFCSINGLQPLKGVNSFSYYLPHSLTPSLPFSSFFLLLL